LRSFADVVVLLVPQVLARGLRPRGRALLSLLVVVRGGGRALVLRLWAAGVDERAAVHAVS
jgi:hypothetical protein